MSRSLIIHYWGDVTYDGTLVQAEIITNTAMLSNLINRLDDNGMELLGFNEAGIIIDYKDDRMSDRLYEVERKIDENQANIINHQTRITDLESNYLPVDPVRDAEKHKDVTGEFYLLYGCLPEEFKKKLKIYIKQEE